MATRTASAGSRGGAGISASTRRMAERVRPRRPSAKNAPEDAQFLADDFHELIGSRVEERALVGYRAVRNDKCGIRRRYDLPRRQCILKEVANPDGLVLRQADDDKPDRSIGRDVRFDG